MIAMSRRSESIGFVPAAPQGVGDRGEPRLLEDRPAR